MHLPQKSTEASRCLGYTLDCYEQIIVYHRTFSFYNNRSQQFCLFLEISGTKDLITKLLYRVGIYGVLFDSIRGEDVRV